MTTSMKTICPNSWIAGIEHGKLCVSVTLNYYQVRSKLLFFHLAIGEDKGHNGIQKRIMWKHYQIMMQISTVMMT